ncbi:MAG: SUMF1/EgtB/PvdO family nonheme iron enzyme [Verrucomicrobia bacterium]|nr:SUMF1/EgtB/PvdO family nonheme iron enzyme [Verrucomicrobiota bacterium]
MFFNPVPIVSLENPNAATAKTLLFAVHETADRHLAAFLKETAPNSSRHDQGLKPASHVSWSEAVAFCEWLTKKELAQGTLQAGQYYRLPSDHEWSCAAGIGHLESPKIVPELKDKRIPNKYPWGESWPPPEGAGNLAGSESSSLFPENHIVGFRDRYRGNKVGYQASSPNRFGLYDLSGNLWEWCSDSFRPGQNWRVLRGGSWLTARADTLLCSHRTHDPENYRSDSVGFRCVLDGFSAKR